MSFAHLILTVGFQLSPRMRTKGFVIATDAAVEKKTKIGGILRN